MCVISLERVEAVASDLLGSLWKNRKDQRFKVCHIARNPETQRVFVVYENIADGDVWVRAWDVFFDGRLIECDV